MGSEIIDLSWRIERRNDASWFARQRVTDALQQVAAPPTVANAALLTSELVTNVMVHTADECRVSLRFDPSDRLVRVDVTDSSPELLPIVTSEPKPPGVVGGFGLKLVAGLATDWGADVSSDTKTVWFLLADNSDI
jgi:anti-sigma regulatory factor (Ser/Thr protein kinase)